MDILANKSFFDISESTIDCVSDENVGNSSANIEEASCT